ncbi:EAL domain-containing protein [Sphingosinicella sp. LHD-64]|uniref:putative bifunctional diguanylate cyclase/phosphodiesterase n=1 Tax=Sphingosinicella sp. LHD-64 TaxID=3072139 RepID=UPI00280D1ABB|nr:EAL domain-containing protein [Sphingosinicella sp. LHD-64]MDQ8757133.1 EAL domain-containing protein [Sphingosinicella sp. LHD-64]
MALCIAVEHDPWLVALAVIICCAGAFAIVQMFERARSTPGAQRFAWAFLTSVAAGATIWCTHFVAMLAFEARAPVTLDPVLTIASLVVAVTGCFVGFATAAWGSKDIYGAVGGALFGLAISAMHYTGMAAYRVDGIVTWDKPYVVASVLCAMIFAGAALTALRPNKVARHRLALGTVLIVLAIASLHFVAMTAMNIAPLALDATPLRPEELRALALATALVGAIVIAAAVFAALIDRQTRSDARRDLTYMAFNDTLTGLPNRRGFQGELERRIEMARTTETQVGLCAIDLNRFKEINDLYGHKAGDDVLVLIAHRLRTALGPGDLVARLGGDEFIAVTRFSDRAHLTAFANRLSTIVKAPMSLGHFEARLGASIGVAVFPQDAEDAGTLANNADLAMYRAKTEGAPGPRYYNSQLDEAVRERRELANDLRHAIERNELEVHYHVQTRAATGAVTGYEALLRWTHPTKGPIAPSVFIAIAEEHGLILALGEWVLRRACADAIRWEHESKVAVNVSPLQLAHADLPQLFHQVMVETGLSPRRLEIELTESAIMADRERALFVLRQIKALGVGVALDDFGTGYSSLETLRVFPFDKIKLDRFFTAELEGSPQATAIIRAVLALGKSLAIPVLAEGVETRAQLDILLREGCDEVQGFLFGYPASFDATARQAHAAAGGMLPALGVERAA